jgi:hypothetical protein
METTFNILSVIKSEDFLCEDIQVPIKVYYNKTYTSEQKALKVFWKEYERLIKENDLNDCRVFYLV